jgi:DHA2 family multidrug resistance protein-like MFS transporter
MSLAPKAARREWTGLAVLSLPTMLIAMDLTVLYLAVHWPRISHPAARSSCGSSTSTASWWRGS